MDFNSLPEGSNNHSCNLENITPEKIRRVRCVLSDEKRFHMMAELYRTMADPSRNKILACLIEGEFCVCELASLLGMSHSAVSHQLRILRANRLVKYRRSGKLIYYSLDDEHVKVLMEQAIKHIDEFR